MKNLVPQKIVDSLVKLEKKTKLNEEEKTALDTFLSTLETSIVNPACTSKVLVNPYPNEVDVSLRHEKSLEDRIRHINTVSARVRASMQPQDPSELDFSTIEDQQDLLPKSVFEIADHELPPFVEEQLPEAPTEPNPDLQTEAEPPPPQGGEADIPVTE